MRRAPERIETQRLLIRRPSIGVVRLQALAHAEHRASHRVLEKCGFVNEGVLRKHSRLPNLADEPSDVCCYPRVW